MTQRYYVIDNQLGINLYQVYDTLAAGTPTIVGPSNATQLGMKVGTYWGGNLNTNWVLAVMGAASPAVTPGTVLSVLTKDGTASTNSSFAVAAAAAANSIPATALVTVAAAPATQGWLLWMEISGAVLNLATSP